MQVSNCPPHRETKGGYHSASDLASHVVGVEMECADVLADLLDGCKVLEHGRAHVEDLLRHARRLAGDL